MYILYLFIQLQGSPYFMGKIWGNLARAVPDTAEPEGMPSRYVITIM